MSRASAVADAILRHLGFRQNRVRRDNPAHHVRRRVRQITRDVRLVREVLERRGGFACRTQHTRNPMASATAVTLQQKSSSRGIASHLRFGLLHGSLVRTLAGGEAKQQEGDDSQHGAFRSGADCPRTFQDGGIPHLLTAGDVGHLTFQRRALQRRALAERSTASRAGCLRLSAVSTNIRQRAPSNSPTGSRAQDFFSDSRSTEGAKIAAPALAA